MLSLYDMLRCARTGLTCDMWTFLAAESILGPGYEHTDDTDYISDGNRICYYKGLSVRPEIPQTIGGVQVKTVSRTAFAGLDTEAVKIPEGVEAIE